MLIESAPKIPTKSISYNLDNYLEVQYLITNIVEFKPQIVEENSGRNHDILCD